MSLTFSPYAVIASLVKAEDFLGQDRKWEPGGECTTKQFFFLTKYFYRGAIHALGIPEIEATASTEPQVINQFFHEHGLDLSMGPIEPGSFAIASIMDAFAQWMKPATPTTIVTKGDNRFEAMHHNEGLFVKICNVKDDPHPAVCIMTSDPNLRVWVKIGDDPTNEFNLLRQVLIASNGIERDNHPEDLSGVILPMVDLNHLPDLDWLIGLNTTDVHGIPFKIVQVMADDRLRMNLEGIRAQAAVAIKIAIAGVGDKPKPYVIDQPFYLWIERNGLNMPLFTAYVTEEHWRNPGDLD